MIPAGAPSPDQARAMARRHLPPTWWLEIECPCGGCGQVSLRLDRLMARAGPAAWLGAVATKLSCAACGQRPELVTLVDNPAKADGGGYAPEATVAVRIVAQHEDQ